MTRPFVVHGARGTGSVAVEAALTLLELPYRLEEDPDGQASPLGQVPALIPPSGGLMTESAAILIWLAEEHPSRQLSPAVGDPARPVFLRWMTFVSAAIYSLYWIRDDPSRLADEAHEAVILERTAERITRCWTVMEDGLSPGPFLLGERLTVLDIYVAVVSRWQPRRKRFYEVAPGIGQAVRRVDADPRLAALWADRFPFEPGWEG
ncbi:MAG: glutathione S-transferase family protein [Caulobacteraceae bacterium]|nr:glutathione S-transferase family protein [Caulobacteraceae bacterium]